jgi:sterol desaturase/sphingolipid hydroxylase (fatty acid hydroxylase superfamily)
MTDPTFLDSALAHPALPQVGLFTLILTLIWYAEFHVLRPESRSKWRHGGQNLSFVLLCLPIQLVSVQLPLSLATWVAQHRWGLVFLLPSADSPLIKYGLMFLALDFLDYLYHRLMHLIPFLWRFHQTHHSDEALDVSSTVREHPGETLLRNLFLACWVVITGASVEMLVLRQTVETLSNIFSHTALRLPERLGAVVGWLFITPNLHQVHHHRQLPATDRNFGDVFSIWDRLFGTLLEMRREQIRFGLDPVSDTALSESDFGQTPRPAAAFGRTAES